MDYLIFNGERVAKLPKNFVVNENHPGGVACEILERTDYLLFLRCKPAGTGSKQIWYDVVNAIHEPDCAEYCKLNPIPTTEPDSVYFSKDKMHAIYLSGIEKSKKSRDAATRVAADDATRSGLERKWSLQVDYVRGLQAPLIEELKRLTADFGADAFDKKRVKEICSQLASCESFIHHGKARIN